jgi:hypothetical protein
VAGNTIHGRVTDRDSGKPLPGAEVAVLQRRGRWWSELARVTADREGRYRFAGVPPGLLVMPRVAPGTAADALDARQWQPDATLPEVALREGRAVRFPGTGGEQAIDIEGIARAGVTITFVLQFGDAEVPRSVRVTHGYSTEREIPDADARGDFSTTRSVARGRVIRTVKGTRVFATQQSTVRTAIDPTAPAVTLRLPAGANRVSFATDTHASAVFERTVMGAGGDERLPWAMQRKPRVWVQLVDGAGGAVRRQGIEVECHRLRADGRGGEAAFGLGYAETDANGRAEITDLLEPLSAGTDGGHDEFEVFLAGPGLFGASGGRDEAALRLSGAALTAKLAAGGEVVLPATVFATRPLQLRVVDVEGRPQRGVTVEVSPDRQFAQASAESNADGVVTFDWRGDPTASATDENWEEMQTLEDRTRFEVRSGGLAGTIAFYDVRGHEP